MLNRPAPLAELDAPQLDALARGCALLGSGGGGDPALALAAATHAVSEHGPVPVVALDALPDDAVVLPCGQTGSMFVASERLWSGDEGRVLREAIERRRGVRVAALMPFQIGGANGLLPVVWAARLGLPLADADGMGRTFAALHQQAMHLAGVPAAPVAVTDGRETTVLVEAATDIAAGRLAGAVAGAMGGVAATALYAMTALQARDAAVSGSLSRAHAVGGTPHDELPQLIEGRVIEIEQRPDGTSATVRRGRRRMRLESRGEYLLALEDGAVAAAVPDIISVLSAETGEPIARRGAAPWGGSRRSSRFRLPTCGARPVASRWSARARSGTTSSTHRSVAETRLGLDVGPTRTIAVVLDSGDRVIARAEAPGPSAALAALAGHSPRFVVIDAGSVLADALARGRLARVAVVRIGAPLTLAVPPLATWPAALRAAVAAGTTVVAGGAEYDGTVTALDEDAIARFLERVRPAAVAIAGVFASIAPEQELAATDVARRTLGRDIPVAVSHEIGTLGLLERENATVLNAALTGAFDELGAPRAAPSRRRRRTRPAATGR